VSPAVQASRFLDPGALNALSHMRFSTKRRIEGSYSGRHQSRQQGGAGEFVDYRQYSGGEDLRRLDWKVLGRTGKSFVRIYQDETNLLCTLALDVSGSMAFGNRRGDRPRSPNPNNNATPSSRSPVIAAQAATRRLRTESALALQNKQAKRQIAEQARNDGAIRVTRNRRGDRHPCGRR